MAHVWQHMMLAGTHAPAQHAQRRSGNVLWAGGQPCFTAGEDHLWLQQHGFQQHAVLPQGAHTGLEHSGRSLLRGLQVRPCQLNAEMGCKSQGCQQSLRETCLHVVPALNEQLRLHNWDQPALLQPSQQVSTSEGLSRMRILCLHSIDHHLSDDGILGQLLAVDLYAALAGQTAADGKRSAPLGEASALPAGCL